MATTDTTTPNVISVRGGKVHRGLGEHYLGGDVAFPRCRTAAMTNSGTRYTETTLEVTCTNCLKQDRLRAEYAEQRDTETVATPTFAETVDTLAGEYRTAEVNGHVNHAVRNAVIERLLTASRAADISDEDGLGDLFDEILAPPVAKSSTRRQTKAYGFGDEIRFTNRWGQENQIFTVINQDGDRAYGDYLGIGNLLDLTTMQIVETDGLGRPIVKG